MIHISSSSSACAYELFVNETFGHALSKSFRVYNCVLYPQEGQAYAEENGLFFMETSAKTAQNVNELFYEIGTLPPLLLCLFQKNWRA